MQKKRRENTQGTTNSNFVCVRHTGFLNVSATSCTKYILEFCVFSGLKLCLKSRKCGKQDKHLGKCDNNLLQDPSLNIIVNSNLIEQFKDAKLLGIDNILTIYVQLLKGWHYYEGSCCSSPTTAHYDSITPVFTIILSIIQAPGEIVPIFL